MYLQYQLVLYKELVISIVEMEFSWAMIHNIFIAINTTNSFDIRNDIEQ